MFIVRPRIVCLTEEGYEICMKKKLEKNGSYVMIVVRIGAQFSLLREDSYIFFYTRLGEVTVLRLMVSILQLKLQSRLPKMRSYPSFIGIVNEYS